MVSKRKSSGNASSMPGGIAVGTAASVMITFLGSVITAYLIERETIQEDGVGYAAVIILILASITGCLVAAKRIKHQRMLVCMICGVCYFAVLLASTALVFGGQYAGVGATAITVLGSSFAVALLGLRNGKGSIMKHKKRAYR